MKLIPFFGYSHVFAFAWSNRLGGYWSINTPAYADAYYAADREGKPFYFDRKFINLDRVIIGFKFTRSNFGMSVDGALPFNAYKAFSLNTGFSVVF